MSSKYTTVEKLGFCERPDNILWSYEQDQFASRASSGQTFFEFPVFGCDSAPKSIFEESLRAARLISAKHKAPTLLLSGGVDSEMVLLSFYLQKLPLKVVIVDYDGMNEHDIRGARELCQKLGVSYQVKEFNLFAFWENDMESLAKKVHCTSPQVAALCQIVSEIDGYVIVGDGDSSIKGLDKRFFESKSENWALARWMLQENHEGCPRFFQYTKELEASWYFEPLVEQFVAAGTWEFFDFRNFIYLKPFIAHKYFGSKLRPKFNGFENIKQCEDFRQKLIQMIGPVAELHWSYEDAKKWAVQPQPPGRLVPLHNSELTNLEKKELAQNGNKTHLIWMD
jgi:hypothetical protein